MPEKECAPIPGRISSAEAVGSVTPRHGAGVTEGAGTAAVHLEGSVYNRIRCNVAVEPSGALATAR